MTEAEKVEKIEAAARKYMARVQKLRAEYEAEISALLRRIEKRRLKEIRESLS